MTKKKKLDLRDKITWFAVIMILLIIIQIIIFTVNVSENTHMRNMFIHGINTVLLLLLIVIIALVRRSFALLKGLNSAITNIQGKNLAQRIRIKSKDELGQLGDALNIMLDSLDLFITERFNRFAAKSLFNSE